MRSEPVMSEVRRRTGVTPQVDITPVGATTVVEVRVESSSARKAAVLSNAYVEAYVAYRRGQAVDALQASSKDIQSRIDDLQRQADALSRRSAALRPCVPPTDTSSCDDRQRLEHDRDVLISQQVPLKQRLDELQVDSSARNGGAAIVRHATVPATPVRPAPVRNGVLGLAAGLTVATGLAFLWERLDTSIRSKEDLEQAAPALPVLGVIPVATGRRKSETRPIIVAQPASPAAEAYRTLRTSIRSQRLGGFLRTVQVTSPRAREGKTTLVSNLAIALAQSGQAVIMVDCDLRRPGLHQQFGVANTVGFTSVVRGESTLAGALQPVAGYDRRLLLLPSGPLAPNPAEVLSSASASNTVTALRDLADLVLFDCPPVLPVTDAGVLSSEVDGTLLVARVSLSASRQVERAVELLKLAGATLVGTVLNGVPGEDIQGYAWYADRDRADGSDGLFVTPLGPEVPLRR
jgi:capsular exopolysaccharide synthesis family protein